MSTAPAGSTGDQVVLIRPIAHDDGPLIERYASDARIAATSHVPHPYPRGGGAVFASRAVDAWKDGVERAFAITSDGVFVGVVSLMALDHTRRRAQIGYWVAVDYWGNGFATEAVRQAARAAFEEFGLAELGAGCLAENLASARVLEKAGFAEGAPLVYRGPDKRFEGRTIRTFTLRSG